MSRPHAIAVGLLLFLGIVPGCGPGLSSVSGKVTYQGKPVVWGSVTLKAADGSIHQIGINTDGTYRLDGVPAGPAVVAVSSPDPAPSPRAKALADPRAPAPPPVPPGAWFPLPARYADPATSGLTLQVGSGPADIDLK